MSVAVVARRPRTVLADLVPGALVRDLALVLAGAGLTGLAAQVSIPNPWSPVPFTLQTLAVVLVGALLGSLRALTSLSLYLVAGLVGVPWYADHHHGFAGIASFGYIIGFVVAATVLGWLAERGADRNVLKTIPAMLLGEAIILLIGTAYLKVDLHVSVGTAVSYGVTPFLGTDLVKLGVAALALPAAWKAVGRFSDR